MDFKIGLYRDIFGIPKTGRVSRRHSSACVSPLNVPGELLNQGEEKYTFDVELYMRTNKLFEKVYPVFLPPFEMKLRFMGRILDCCC